MSSGPRHRPGDAGVTLVEMLVVLAILGIAAGASVLAISAADRAGSAGTEAQRLSDRLGLAVDEALVGGTPLALAWDETGYRFLRWDGAAASWQPDASALLGARHALPQALTLSRIDDLAPDRPQPILIDPDAAGSSAVLQVGEGARAARVAFDGYAATALPRVAR